MAIASVNRLTVSEQRRCDLTPAIGRAYSPGSEVLDQPGLRDNVRVVRRVGTLALLVAVAACGAPSVVPAGPHYEVVAPMLQVQGHPLMACYMILSSLPPAGCGGVPVRGLDVGVMGGITRFHNGTIQTPTVRLVGVWDGHVLTLAERPQSTTARGTEPAPVDEAPPADAEGGVFERIQADMPRLQQQGVQILSFGVDTDGV